MPRAQCIVARGNTILMVKHQQDGQTWWCLPGGGIESGEEPNQAALRELWEECHVAGRIVRHTSFVVYAPGDEAYSYLVDIGDQEPRLGCDPELDAGHAILAGFDWLRLCEIPERDRAFLWAAGLLGVPEFLAEVETWGNTISYPGAALDEERA